MAEEPNNISRYVTLDDIVKLYLIQVGAVNNSRYNQYITLAQLAYQELEFDVLKKFTYRYLPVDSATKTVAIPDDMLQYTMIGFVNQVGEVIELTYDPKLVFRQEVLSPVCHCDDCGCTDEVCSAISNVVKTDTTVTIPTPSVSCDYTVQLLFSQYVGVCTPPATPFTIVSIAYGSGGRDMTTTFSPAYPIANAGDYTAFKAAYVIQGLGYKLTYGNATICTQTVSYFSDYPMTVVSYVKNGTTITDGTVCANLAELDAFMATLGWSNSGGTSYVTDAPTTDTWESFVIDGATVQAETVYSIPSSCSLTTTDVEYTNYCRTCTNASGDIVRECCTYGGNFSDSNCSYEIALINGDGESFGFPLTDGVININGENVNMGTIDSLPDLLSYLEDKGFAITDLANLVMNGYGLTDIFTTISSVLQDLTLTFTQSLCYTPIEISCVTETICNVPVKECGCAVLSDKEINTLYNANIINNTMYERWIHGGDISTTYLQPYNLYGFYNVDMHKGIIQLDPFFKYDTIYLEYYGSSEVSTKNFAVPLLARDFILAYIHKMANLRTGRLGRGELEYIKKECRAAKHNLRLRWQPPREKQIIDLIKTPPAKG